MDVVSPPSVYEPILITQDVLDGYRQKSHVNNRCAVFVHGVAGNLHSTWENTRNSVKFFQLITQDEDLGDYDVFTF